MDLDERKQRHPTAAPRQECTAHWVRPLPETPPEAAKALRHGPTTAAISGSLGASGRCLGNSSRLPQRPLGVQSFHRQRMGMDGREQHDHLLIPAGSTARWERPLPETFPEAAMAQRAGPTAAATSGSLVAMAAATRHYWLSQRPLGVQSFHEPMDLDGRKQHDREQLLHNLRLCLCGVPGVYGTLGTPAAGNIPGGRRICFGLDRQQRQFLALWGLATMPTVY